LSSACGDEAAAPVIELRGVDVFVPERGAGGAPRRKLLLEGITWAVRPGEHWAVLGPNGAGKSTLLALAAARRHPSRGSVSVLGGRLGRVDIASLHPRIGLVDPRVAPPPYLDVTTVVLTGVTGTVQPRLRDGTALAESAGRALALVDGTSLSRRTFGSLSTGERARVLIARSLVAAPELLLLDEPAAGLDLPGREDLLAVLARLATEHPSLATVLIAHLLEEIPPSVTHALLIARGRQVAAGPVEAVLRDEALSECFARRVTVQRRDGRWSALASR